VQVFNSAYRQVDGKAADRTFITTGQIATVSEVVTLSA
jgi:hypothetical protein